MAHLAAISSVFGRFLLILALFASSALAPLLSQHISLKRAAEVRDVSEVEAPAQTYAVVKKFGKLLRLSKCLQQTAMPDAAASERPFRLVAGIAALLYPCVRLLLRRVLLMPIKFTSSYVVEPVR